MMFGLPTFNAWPPIPAGSATPELVPCLSAAEPLRPSSSTSGAGAGPPPSSRASPDRSPAHLSVECAERSPGERNARAGLRARPHGLKTTCREGAAFWVRGDLRGAMGLERPTRRRRRGGWIYTGDRFRENEDDLFFAARMIW